MPCRVLTGVPSRLAGWKHVNANITHVTKLHVAKSPRCTTHCRELAKSLLRSGESHTLFSCRISRREKKLFRQLHPALVRCVPGRTLSKRMGYAAIWQVFPLHGGNSGHFRLRGVGNTWKPIWFQRGRSCWGLFSNGVKLSTKFVLWRIYDRPFRQMVASPGPAGRTRRDAKGGASFLRWGRGDPMADHRGAQGFWGALRWRRGPAYPLGHHAGRAGILGRSPKTSGRRLDCVGVLHARALFLLRVLGRERNISRDREKFHFAYPGHGLLWNLIHTMKEWEIISWALAEPRTLLGREGET